MRGTRVRVLEVSITVGLVILLTGCGVTQVAEPGLTLDEAKAEVIAQQERVLAAVPEAYVAEVNRTDEERSLLRCGDGSFFWPGGINVDLTADADPEAVISSIAEAFRADPEWIVDTEDGISPSPYAVNLTKGGPFGQADVLALGARVFELKDGGLQLSVSGFSRCFEFADFEPFEKY